MARQTVRKREDSSQIAARVALSAAASFAVAAVTIACFAAIYAKSLTGVKYIGDDDEYLDD
ncbi:MAG: hypothetical protein IKX27_02335 [Oscillospiraceae bacterium]|nr:hypothetical protein [Oscillospiraceae bacterium]MBR5045952.1 hypothetical protein [Oscillospiraceae bacterium]MBR5070720.1 hypothetical protein [Oscillospiraceae bacterium]MBR5979604.1 hypothetical protein [Oscillospiraceae bacterium]